MNDNDSYKFTYTDEMTDSDETCIYKFSDIDSDDAVRKVYGIVSSSPSSPIARPIARSIDESERKRTAKKLRGLFEDLKQIPQNPIDKKKNLHSIRPKNTMCRR